MATTIQYVPAGTNGPVNYITPQTSVYAGPQVLGGTTQLYFGPTPVGPWQLWSAGTSLAGDSYRPPVNSYFYVAAATQQSIVAISDMGGANSPQYPQLISMNGTCASPSSTSINKIFSFKIPPLFLPLNFRVTIFGTLNLTNSANVKTLTCLMNGIGGTSFLTQAVTSFANYNFIASFTGDGTGQTLTGNGAGAATGGLGGSTTALTTLSRDYINNETEFVIAATKATGSETFELKSLLVKLD